MPGSSSAAHACCSYVLALLPTLMKESRLTVCPLSMRIICSSQLISPLFTKPFLSAPLSFALVYIWSRRNPSVRMSLMGVVT